MSLYFLKVRKDSLQVSFRVFILSGCLSDGLADLVIAIDESTSVGKTNFDNILSYVSKLIDGLTIGPHAVQIGCFTFSNKITDRFYLNRYQEKATLLSAISGLL